MSREISASLPWKPKASNACGCGICERDDRATRACRSSGIGDGAGRRSSHGTRRIFCQRPLGSRRDVVALVTTLERPSSCPELSRARPRCLIQDDCGRTPTAAARPLWGALWFVPASVCPVFLLVARDLELLRDSHGAYNYRVLLEHVTGLGSL